MDDSYINDDIVFLDINDFKEEEWEFIKDIFDVPSDEECVRIIVPQHEIITK